MHDVLERTVRHAKNVRRIVRPRFALVLRVMLMQTKKRFKFCIIITWERNNYEGNYATPLCDFAVSFGRSYPHDYLTMDDSTMISREKRVFDRIAFPWMDKSRMKSSRELFPCRSLMI